jgi:hypothetical protein
LRRIEAPRGDGEHFGFAGGPVAAVRPGEHGEEIGWRAGEDDGGVAVDLRREAVANDGSRVGGIVQFGDGAAIFLLIERGLQHRGNGGGGGGAFKHAHRLLAAVKAAYQIHEGSSLQVIAAYTHSRYADGAFTFEPKQEAEGQYLIDAFIER